MRSESVSAGDLGFRSCKRNFQGNSVDSHQCHARTALDNQIRKWRLALHKSEGAPEILNGIKRDVVEGDRKSEVVL